MWWSRAAALVLVAGACGGSEGGAQVDPGLEGLAVTSIKPAVLVPGTVLDVTGKSYVDTAFGTTRVRLRGTLGGSSLDVAVPARFVDYGKLEIKVDAAFLDLLPVKTGKLEGEAVVEVDSKIDKTLHASTPLKISLDLRDKLTPRLDTLETSQVIYVNEPMEVKGDGLLRGGDEGTTFAVVEGCFKKQGTSTCVPVTKVEVPVVPADPYDRTRGEFAFTPDIAGIRPGDFQATVKLKNSPKGGSATESTGRSSSYALLTANIEEIAPTGASLGQYIEVRGNGFVGEGSSGLTTLKLKGKLTRKTGDPIDVDMTLVPEFVRGPLVRYVLNEDDSLGRAFDLRRDTATFTGTITPVTSFETDSVTGSPTTITFKIQPVKQVVWINFLPSYVESLRDFGLRAVDAQVRARVLEVARRDYATVNVEFRETRPTDFAQYAQVDISGPDPNQQGLLGYDNTPGKDNDNSRLFDRIGGVNATTQEDGSAGYGGVFIESMFAFSKHPEGHAKALKDNDGLFDDIFDEFRADSGGDPITAADFAGGGIPKLTSGDSCPATDRKGAAACAVWVMGSLIGTTMTHEIGHSLGLANPNSDGFHNFGDEPNRLMDAGGARPFRERAELDGEGPAVFCDEEYEYLRRILPSEAAADSSERPPCF